MATGDAARPQPVKEDAHVIYGVKELLSDIKSTVVGMDAKLDSKADKAEVAVVVQRVDDHERRLDKQEWLSQITDKANENSRETRRFRLPLIISVSALFISPFIWDFVNHLPWK